MRQVFETRKILLASSQQRSLVYKALGHSAKYVGGVLSLEGLCDIVLAEVCVGGGGEGWQGGCCPMHAPCGTMSARCAHKLW